MEIPEHLQPTWNAVREELHEASITLNAAESRHSRAILDRIKLADTSSPEWEIVTKELDEAKIELQKAYRRYHAVIVARQALSDTLNSV